MLLSAVTTPVRASVQTGEPPNLAREGIRSALRPRLGREDSPPFGPTPLVGSARPACGVGPSEPRSHDRGHRSWPALPGGDQRELSYFWDKLAEDGIGAERVPMDENIEEPTSVSETLPEHLLSSIEREQLMRMTAVDAVWRLSSVMLICSAIMAPSIHWLRASVLLLVLVSHF